MSTNLIEIVEYKPEWVNEFARISAQLAEACKSVAERIDHIGSTSVPGLPAKDRIDVQITIFNSDDFEAVLNCLGNIGYNNVARIQDDHVPAFGPFEEKQWEKRFFNQPAGERAINLHVRVKGAANQRYALLFREYLRHHPHAATSYALTKKNLARYHPTNIEAYCDIKDPVCDLIMQAAIAWAAETNWQIPPADVPLRSAR